MKKSNKLYNKAIVIGLFIVFVGMGFLSSVVVGTNNEQDLSTVTFYTFDRTGTKKCKTDLSTDVAEEIFDLFDEVKDKIISNPYSKETNYLKNDLVEMLEKHGLISGKISKDYAYSLLEPRWNRNSGESSPLVNCRGCLFRNRVLPGPFANTGSSFFCSMAGGGSGVLFPPIMMPRPRLATVWSAYLDDAISIASNLYTGHGFAAMGSQLGIAIGFWGIGLSFAVPGEPAFFGFGGYSLAAFVGADEIETYPPNKKPIISDENPSDGSVDVPTSLSELSFRIGDGDGDRMSYSVTTNPDIGSGNGSNVVGGVYSILVSGLNSDTLYSWCVVVSDDEDVSEETFSFRTAKEAPFVSDPLPVDGDDWVSVNISELSFRLQDFQGDLMDFSVETFPDIGSGSGSGVGDGVYSISVSDLEYTSDYSWFVNVTDGQFWTRRIFGFRTQPLMVFDPFEKGWNFRKKITVDHSKVAGDLSDFPVLVSVVDADLAVKAQDDGNDVLFMDGSGVANRLFHEIEEYDGSNGQLVAWVNVTSLSSYNNTVFYLYYGNTGVSSQQYPENVWDSNFALVLHMTGSSYIDLDDSSLYNNDVNNEGGNPVYNYDGKIGKCVSFDGNGDYLKATTFSLPTDSSHTGTCWIRLPSIEDERRMMLESDNGWSVSLGYRYSSFSHPIIQAYTDTSDGGTYHTSTYPLDINEDTWYFVGTRIDALNNKIIVWLDESGHNEKSIAGKVNSAKGINIGTYRDNNGRWMEGEMDEIQISNIVRSDSWLKTQFYNQNDPLDFYSIGPEESGP